MLDVEVGNDPKRAYTTQNKISVGNDRFLFN